MSGINLPRGRFTDALVGFIVFASVMQLAPSVLLQVFPYGFSPLLFVSGGWQMPLVWLAPIVSQFLLSAIVNVLFNTVLLLIAGRYAEKALGGFGMLGLFVAGAYGGAIARTVLTSQSMLVTASASAGLFAIIGACLMLYGIPAGIPINRNYSRPLQIAAIAAIWVALQVAFMLSSGVFELSVSIIDPLGGLLTGALLARPILAWRYRKA